MSGKLAGFDRFIIFLVAVICLAGGLWTIAVWANFDPITDLNDQIDYPRIGEIGSSQWFDLALGIALVLGIILGLILVISNLTGRSFNKVRSQASTDQGSVALSISKVAKVISEEIAEGDRVNGVSEKVAYDRKRPTVTWTIKAEPTIDLSVLHQRLVESERDFREAVENVDVDTTYRVHLSAVKAS